MKGKIFLIGLLFCTISGLAQQKLKKADKLFADFAYMEAAEAYGEYLKEERNPSAEVIKKAADSYYFTGNDGNALRWYNKLYNLWGDTMDDDCFRRYIHALRVAKDYEKADSLLKARLEAKGDMAALNLFMRQKSHLDSINAAAPSFKVNNISSNSDKSDFGAVFYGNQVVYTSAKDTAKVKGKIYTWNEQPFLELYVADRDTATGTFLNEKKFIYKEQTSYHNATVAFMPDMKTVFYSANIVKPNDKLIRDGEGTGNFEIIKGVIEGNKLSETEKLPFNNVDYSVGHPAVTNDGKWLFFVSDMPGGFGETDIYAAPIGEDGKVGKPKNLGSKINTVGKEMFPFINDSILYFASDGHYGMGRLDVFESRVSGNLEFSEPVNLGKPVNGNKDDFAFITDKAKMYGYFSSNRNGGKGDDDIYYFKRQLPCMQKLSGTVADAKSKGPVDIADVKIYDATGKLIASAKTKPDGTYSVQVPCNSKVTVEVSKPDHSIVKQEVEIPARSGRKPKTIDFELSDYNDLVKQEDNMEKIDINPIYFDFDKYDITPRAIVELDKVVFVMQNFPNVIIKIESHTDSRGNDEYNMILSDNRAKSTYNYIISKGIDAARIESVKGYGESLLRNKCSNGVECTEEEHQLNRRSDFIVVKK